MSTFPDERRGSARLLETWAERGRHVITDEDIKFIASRLEESPAQVADVVVDGGDQPSGFGLALNYDGDDGRSAATTWPG